MKDGWVRLSSRHRLFSELARDTHTHTISKRGIDRVHRKKSYDRPASTQQCGDQRKSAARCTDLVSAIRRLHDVFSILRVRHTHAAARSPCCPSSTVPVSSLDPRSQSSVGSRARSPFITSICTATWPTASLCCAISHGRSSPPISEHVCVCVSRSHVLVAL